MNIVNAEDSLQPQDVRSAPAVAYVAPTLVPLGQLRQQTQGFPVAVGGDGGIYAS